MPSQKRKKTNNPSKPTAHDRFAKWCLASHGIAKDLLRCYADPVLDQQIDLDAMVPAPTHSITSNLKEIVRDITFLTHLRNTELPAEVMFLLEHKSRPSHCVGLQLGTQAFSLMYSRWTEEKYTSSKKFTPPIPIMIVLYHGKEKWAWKELWFQDLFPNLPPELKNLVPQFRIIVINLARFSYDNLPGEPLTRAFVESLKRAMDGTFAENIGRIFKLVQDAGLDKDQAEDFMKTILRYCKYSDSLTAEQFEKSLVKAFDESEGKEMYKAYSTGFSAEAFQKGVKEGVEKGVKKGEKRGEKKSIVKALRHRFNNVTPEIVKPLKKIKSSAALNSLFDCAMRCSTLDEFTQKLQNVLDDHGK